jgi:Tol biopolymer transport system component
LSEDLGTHTVPKSTLDLVTANLASPKVSRVSPKGGLKATAATPTLTGMRRRPAFTALVAPSALLAAMVALAVAPVEPARGAFPGENGRIAFAAGAIKTIRPDGTKARRVTRPQDWQVDSQPAFSPSGERIAFARDFFRGPRRDWKSRIYIVRTDGSHLHRLKPRRRPRLRYYHSPAFSPSGRRIAFEGCRRAEDRPHLRCALFTIKTDGTRQSRITPYTPNDGANSNPTFSPNGRMIAFEDLSGACNIYVMRADGSDLHALTDNERGCDSHPSFSPDGSEIAFTSNRCTSDAFVQPQICVMRADGTDVRPLTASDDFGAIDFSFSPNGKRITFTFIDALGDWYGLWVMRADGTEERKLVTGSDPDWGVR